MALNGFLRIPDIPGEARAADHEGAINVHGLNWQFSRDEGAQTGRGRAQSRTEVAPLVLSKFTDASSPYLMLANLQGKAFDEITLTLRKDSGDAHLDYLVITLSNCVISSFEMDTPHDDGVIAEQVAITCEKINVIYTVQADDHSAGDAHEISFNIARGG